MTEREANSRRYWRLNTLMAFRAMVWPDLSADPEEWARRQADARERRELEAREAAVNARHARIKARGSSPTP